MSFGAFYWLASAALLAAALVGVGFAVARGFRLMGEYNQEEGEAATMFWLAVVSFLLVLIWPVSLLVGAGYWFGRGGKHA